MDFGLLKSRADELLKQNHADEVCTLRYLCGQAHLKRHNEVLKTRHQRGTGDSIQCHLCKDGLEEPYHVITTCEAIHTLCNKHLGASILTRSSVAKSKYPAPRRRLADFHKTNLLVRRLGTNFIAEPNIFN
jgi:hypothetical protein